MPAPDFKKIVLEDKNYTFTIYGGSVKLQTKGKTFKRKAWRIALKPAAGISNRGELFKVSKLIVRAQEGTFEKLIELPEIQQWLFKSCVEYIQAEQPTTE